MKNYIVLTVETDDKKSLKGRIADGTGGNANAATSEVNTEKHRTREQQNADGNVNAEGLKINTKKHSTGWQEACTCSATLGRTHYISTIMLGFQLSLNSLIKLERSRSSGQHTCLSYFEKKPKEDHTCGSGMGLIPPL